MSGLEALLPVILWLIGVPLVVFGLATLVGFDWKKPWLMWRKPAGPLPLRVYVGVSAFIALGLLVAAATR